MALGQGLALNHFQLRKLHQKLPDPIRLGGKTSALAHVPAGIAAYEMQLARGIADRDLGDVADAQT
ncbi:MAG: hypothetical protein E6H75_14665, partial [Betaproteobacteria bacterium]